MKENHVAPTSEGGNFVSAIVTHSTVPKFQDHDGKYFSLL